MNPIACVFISMHRATIILRTDSSDPNKSIRVGASRFHRQASRWAVCYQLAAAVDDAQPQFTAVVRGADLLDSTYRQLWLQQLLDLESPQYAHVTVVNDGLGNKLSKQTGAPALVTEHATKSRTALSHPKQAAPPDTARRVADILDFATEHWSFPCSH